MGSAGNWHEVGQRRERQQQQELQATMSTPPPAGGIIFFNHSTKHIARLVVAIHSLRKQWPEAPACILDTGAQEAAEIIDKIGSDDRLFVGVKQFKMRQLRRNSCYVAKAGLWRHSPFNNSLLVDSDVLFLKSPAVLLEKVADRSQPGFLVTAFSDWRCDGKTISGRLEKWHDVYADGFDVSKLIHQAKERKAPAINTGVVGMRGDDHESRETLRLWETLTAVGWRNPFTDELAAQILIEHRRHQIVPEIYNSSVLYAKDRAGAAISHYHGSKHTRPEDGGRWIGEYQEACKLGLAGIAEWGAATDSRLAGLA